jgi:putative FmdB family regulatory protein
MPIYAYRCESCGHSMDALQKISDAPLVDCPACGAATLRKQVTAAGFQLKGSGWYVTDFRGDGKKPGADPKPDSGGEGAAQADAAPKAETPAKTDAAKPEPAKADTATKTESSSTAPASPPTP